MPGSNYTRNITIYINGKQVSNDIKSIRGEMRHLINAQAKMTIGSKEYVKAGQEIKKLDRVLANHRKSLKTTSNSIVNTLKNYAIGFLGVTTVIRVVTRVIGDAIRVNREFESTFSNVLTLLDEAQKKQFGNFLKRGVIDLMSEFGFEIADINKALFDVISNGVPAGEAIAFLRKNAELAIGGVSTLSATVKGTTKLMNTYGVEAKNVGEITSALFAAQVKGATTVELLSDNVGKLASISAQSNIPLNEMLAIFAGLTKQLDGTEESATALRQVIASIIKPTEEAKGIYKKLGIDVGQTALQQDGLLNKLLEVSAAAKGNQDILSDLIPNIRAFSGISSLSAESIAELEKNITELNDKEKSAALLQGAMNEKMQDGERQGKMLRGEWNKLLIEVGGGESIFKRIGTAIRIELTDRIQHAQKAVTVLSEGTWVDKLKLAVNTVLRLMAKVLTPLFTIIEKITGKRFELNIEIPEEEKQQVIETAQEITTELTEEEKVRQAKLAAIREAARKLAYQKEREEEKKKTAALDRIAELEHAHHVSLMDEKAQEEQAIIDKYDKEIEKAKEAGLTKEEINNIEYLKREELFQLWLDDLDTLNEEELDKIIDQKEKELNEEEKRLAEEMDLEVAQNAKLARLSRELKEQKIRDQEEAANKTMHFAQELGRILGQSLASTERSFDSVMKALTLTTLRALKDMLIMAIAQTTIRNVKNYGLAGLIKAAIEIALLEAAYSGVEAAVNYNTSQYAKGKYPIHGADDGRLYNANAIGPVTRSGVQNAGRPALINEQGGEIILTAPHSRQLMLRPALFNQVMSLPQKAEGNYPRQQLSGNDYDNLTGEINRLNDSITKLVKKSNRSYIVFQDIENAINEVDDIADYAKV